MKVYLGPGQLTQRDNNRFVIFAFDRPWFDSVKCQNFFAWKKVRAFATKPVQINALRKNNFFEMKDSLWVKGYVEQIGPMTNADVI